MLDYKLLIIATLCILGICQDVSFVSNGEVTYTGYFVGDTVKYHRNSGYSMHGPMIRYCLESGKWTGNATSCESQ